MAIGSVIAELGALITRRELRARYKGSALGFAWHFVMPISQLVVFWILFGVLFGVRPRTETGEQPYAIFLFVGLLPWTFFATALTSGASSIVANGAIVKKVRLPVQLLPASAVLSGLVNFLMRGKRGHWGIPKGTGARQIERWVAEVIQVPSTQRGDG